MKKLNKTAQIHLEALEAQRQADHLAQVASDLRQKAQEAQQRAACAKITPAVAQAVTAEEIARKARIQAADRLIARLLTGLEKIS